MTLSLSLEGAVPSGIGSANERVLNNVPATPVSGAAGSKTVRIGKIPQGSYRHAPPIVVDYRNDEGSRLRREGKLVGPMPLPELNQQGPGCSFAANCDDGDPCTDDRCDIGPGGGAGTGACIHNPVANGDSGDCDDGVYCNGKETCAGASVFQCLGVCVGGANDGNVCASDAANNNGCSGGTCTSRDCQGGPHNGVACTYHEECTDVTGTCTAGALPCSGAQRCREQNDADSDPYDAQGSCQASACAADTDPICNDGNACTVDRCCGVTVGGMLDAVGVCDGGTITGANGGIELKSCKVAGVNLAECPAPFGGDCNIIEPARPCNVNGACDNTASVCGRNGDCFPKFCRNAGPTFTGLACDTLADCGTAGTRVCVSLPLCFLGRCCNVPGACTRKWIKDCGPVTPPGGPREKWYPGDNGQVPPPQAAACTVDFPCPKYGSGIGYPGVYTVLAPRTSISAQAESVTGLVINKLGDDYELDTGAGTYIEMTDLRFTGGVDNITNSRTSFEIYDEFNNFVEDLFFITNVNEILVQDVIFDPPLPIPAKGYVVAHVLQQFAAPDINSPGEFLWVATDAVDHGANVATRMWINNGPVNHPGAADNILRACTGGLDGGTLCSANGQCASGICGEVPEVLAFEIEGNLLASPPDGACCNATTGVCSQTVPWICEGGGGNFLGEGVDCNICSDNSASAGSPCLVNNDCEQCTAGPDFGNDCNPEACTGAGSSFCVGGGNYGAACATQSQCPGGICTVAACAGTCAPACSTGACCEADGDCNETFANEAACEAVVGNVWQGFGSSCDPNCCDQPLIDYTGADECENAIVHVIPVPDPLSAVTSVTVTITGDNTAASSFAFCADAISNTACTANGVPQPCCTGNMAGTCNNSTNGNSCKIDTQCNPNSGGSCKEDDECYPPSVPGSELGWFEAFSIDDCAYVRIDHCCTDPVKIPSYRIIYDNCPCGQTIFTKADPNVPDEGPDARGAPYCNEDNGWNKFGPLTAGTYWYPILSFLGGNFGPYQLHIAVKACPVAACCYTKCSLGVNDGDDCDRNTDCPGGTCVAACELLNTLDCLAHNGAYLGPPNRAQANVNCPAVCNTGSCCTGPGECIDDQTPGGAFVGVDKAFCDAPAQDGRYVGGLRCFGGICGSGTNANGSCQVDGDCPGCGPGLCCNASGGAEELAQPSPCPVCEIAGGDNCQIFDDSTNLRPSDLSAAGGGQRTADDFCPLGDTISTVCVWGVYFAPNAMGNNVTDCADDVPDDFHVVVYANVAPGIPDFGNIVGQSDVSTVFKAHLPNTAREDLTQTRVYTYQLILTNAIGGLTADGTVTYWLEVTNDTFVPDDPEPNRCYWNWVGVDTSYNDYSANSSAAGYGEGAARTADQAFCLDIDFQSCPPVTRACCACTGSCTVSNKRDCDNENGKWLINEVDCSPNPCFIGAPANDNCAVVAAGSALVPGDYLFSNRCATTDGPNPIPTELSPGGDSMNSDVWYKFVATCNGEALFSTCASGATGAGADLDTFIAVYHDVNNPTTCVCPNAGNHLAMLWPAGAGADENCVGFPFGAGGFIEGTVSMTAGECYMVRVGGFAGQGGEEGDGVLTIGCTPVGACGAPTLARGDGGGQFAGPPGADLCYNGTTAGAPCSQNSDCPGGSFCHTRNRYLNITPDPLCIAPSVIQVKAISLPAAYAAFVNDIWYAGVPAVVSEQPLPPGLTLKVAVMAACGTGELRNWGAEGNLNLSGAIVMPGGRYEVRHCNDATGAVCGPPLTIETAKHGDVVPPLVTLNPNFGDISAMVAKFQSAPTAISKSRSQMQPAVVNPANNINFLDISVVVGAFQGQQYSQAAPPACP